MRNLVFLFMLVSFSLSAQYDRWAFGAELGVHAVGDQSALVTDAHNHFGLSARYSINPTVSVGLTAGFDNLTLQDLEGVVGETDYGRISAEGFIDVFDVLDLQNNVFTLLFHGGPGMSFIAIDNDDWQRFLPSYTDEVFSLTGGLTGMVKISKTFAATLDYRTTANITQDYTLDGYIPIANADVNSTVTNFSIGLTIYPGKKKDGEKQEHADWYVAPSPVYTNTYVTNVNHVTREYVRNVTESSCECEVVEFVFFDHDKYKIKEQSLNAITKVFDYLNENKNAELWIKGFASATSSSAEYNKTLSRKRAKAIYDKLEAMGTDMNRVSVSSEGKDYEWADESIHDVARRVELIITKK